MNRRRLAAALLTGLLTAAPARAALTEGPRLTAIYDTILSARFDQADAALKRACPPAPLEACAALNAVSVWWRIQQDPNSRALDGRLNDLATAALVAGDAWTRREPHRAEAWFYLAGSYAPLVQWRVLRGERLAAAREGKRIKDALERALQLDQTLADAYFGIGLYHYYADVAPAAAKILRWLLFLPGGDRVKGLEEMLTARERGVLLRGEADYQLHLIYLWYEHNPMRSVELLEGLDSRYPSNPIFLRRLAETNDTWLHDRPAAAAAWQSLVDRAREGRVFESARTETIARLGLASQLDGMYETDRAVDHLEIVVGNRGAGIPRALVAQAHLQLGLAHDRLGERERAVAAYRSAIDESGDRSEIALRARQGLSQNPSRTVTEAYRLSLDGWRAFEKGALPRAATSLARAVDRDPADPIAQYRYARILDASGDVARARQQLDRLIAARTAPAFVLASALVSYGALLERAGERSRAIESYRRAAEVVGSEPTARDQARAALKRLGAA